VNSNNSHNGAGRVRGLKKEGGKKGENIAWG
jgi:hypothetical protein